ncbi:MBL fold metallo-hydrolase [uncultured Eubacterium sp.]|uniref:MBL fold metallo-hydrolase n=1 Tax=uncultured Eubacterium sp. TaxID=165185 RepID=UPI0025D87F1C|nr:MBL fold metallo-hydrolase [uncultured Eubacterium sp.]
MKITYINHSGFLVETKGCYYIFDYYKGKLPSLDKKKEVIVFCSHFHEDHFNQEIFEILNDAGMTYQAVLARDIRGRNHLTGMHFNVAFVPLDPRQENHYADGILYFLENVDCNAIFPMHYWNDASVMKRFVTEYPQYKSRIKNTEAAKGEIL